MTRKTIRDGNGILIGWMDRTAYREILHTNTSDTRKEVLTEGLREYCKLDTLAMVQLAWFFQGELT